VKHSTVLEGYMQWIIHQINYMCVVFVVALINSNNKMGKKEKRPHIKNVYSYITEIELYILIQNLKLISDAFTYLNV
jgi:hypothetical protein